MIPFLELTNWYYSILAIGEPEEKENDSGKNPMKILSQWYRPCGVDGKWFPLSRTSNGTLFPCRSEKICLIFGLDKGSASDNQSSAREAHTTFCLPLRSGTALLKMK
jgi:hypothetical protein